MNLITFRIVKYLLLMFSMLFASPAIVRAENWRPLVMKIKGIEASRGGQIRVFVFVKDGFPTKNDKALKTYTQPVGDGEIMIPIEAPADIPFALKVHHDEDGNNKLTKNWTGIFPTEGLGFSSDAKLNFGPPSFAAAKMSMPESMRVSISMLYP
jgi:uncharacterized protein (DUF2141 family)